MNLHDNNVSVSAGSQPLINYTEKPLQDDNKTSHVSGRSDVVRTDRPVVGKVLSSNTGRHIYVGMHSRILCINCTQQVVPDFDKVQLHCLKITLLT